MSKLIANKLKPNSEQILVAFCGAAIKPVIKTGIHANTVHVSTLYEQQSAPTSEYTKLGERFQDIQRTRREPKTFVVCCYMLNQLVCLIIYNNKSLICKESSIHIPLQSVCSMNPSWRDCERLLSQSQLHSRPKNDPNPENQSTVASSIITIRHQMPHRREAAPAVAL